MCVCVCIRYVRMCAHIMTYLQKKNKKIRKKFEFKFTNTTK